jgi:hypothetical protein
LIARGGETQATKCWRLRAAVLLALASERADASGVALGRGRGFAMGAIARVAAAGREGASWRAGSARPSAAALSAAATAAAAAAFTLSATASSIAFCA